MMRFLRALFGRADEESRDDRRDPDLDMVKHMVEQHEYRLQEMDKDLEAISGGNRRPYVERRALPRPPRRES